MSWFHKNFEWCRTPPPEPEPKPEQYTCPANLDKPECSLVEQIRILKKQQEELINSNTKPTMYDYFNEKFVTWYFESKYIRDIYTLDKYNLLQLVKYINALVDYDEQKNAYENKRKEIRDKIYELKKQLGIE